MNDDYKDKEWIQLTLPGFDPEPPAAETIKKRMPEIQFRMDYLRDPEEALIKEDETGTSYQRWFRHKMRKYASIVIKQTGADPAQIMNPTTQTEEQKQLMAELAAEEQMARIDLFFESLFMDALNHLEPLKGEYADPGEIDFYTDTDRFNPDSEYISIKEQAVLYFFAIHDELRADSRGVLRPDHTEELRNIYKKLDAFYMERTGGTAYEPTPEILYAFIERENPTPETIESIISKLPLMQGIRPTSHVMPNNALMNTLQQRHSINAGEFDMPVANEKKGKRKEITAYTMISFDPGETSIQITDAKLSEYERQVSDAIVSLWIEAAKKELPPIFTTDMIFRAMPGGSDKATAQQKGAITKTIEKFRRLHITVDATEELRKRGAIAKDATFKIDAFYLSVTHAEYRVKNGGQTVSAYRIEAEPIILTYCNMTKQLLTIPAKYIEIKKVKHGKASGELLTMNSNRQAMTGYMLRRIAVMKRDDREAKERKRNYDRRRAKDKTLEEMPLAAFKEQSPVILFETLFADAGLENQSRDKAMDNRNFCFDVLDYQITCGNIKGYEKQIKGRSITGVKIIL